MGGIMSVWVHLDELIRILIRIREAICDDLIVGARHGVITVKLRDVADEKVCEKYLDFVETFIEYLRNDLGFNFVEFNREDGIIEIHTI